MHRCTETTIQRLEALLSRYALALIRVADNAPIPGSYWGEAEAGVVAQSIFVRHDTPVHSVLHEASHVICMDAARRATLHTDAGGNDAEENAVCYLQITLAGQIGISTDEICADMDAWGYTFRLGSALAWFTQDASEVHRWLVHYGLLTESGVPTWKLRVS